MKVLATSDPHGATGVRLDVLAQEFGCAALLIAGDFLDLTGRGAPGEQARVAAAWLQSLAARISVAAWPPARRREEAALGGAPPRAAGRPRRLGGRRVRVA